MTDVKQAGMVERVAMVMCDAAEEDWDAASFNETANGNDPEDQRDYWRMMARAAIEAMRNPPVPVVAAALRAMRTDDFDPVDAEVKAGWNAGIDAALSEPPCNDPLQVKKEMEG